MDDLKVKFIQGFDEYRLTLHQLRIYQIIFVETRVLTDDIFLLLSVMAVGISLYFTLPPPLR